jgi:hypothetical protein
MLGFGMAAVIVVWLAVDVFTNRNRLVQQVIRALED